jgi:hypothetical protein
MNTLTWILLIILILIYLQQYNINISNFENLEFKDSLIIIVTNNEFYYLNIKTSDNSRYEIFRIPLYLVKNFY